MYETIFTFLAWLGTALLRWIEVRTQTASEILFPEHVTTGHEAQAMSARVQVSRDCQEAPLANQTLPDMKTESLGAKSSIVGHPLPSWRFVFPTQSIVLSAGDYLIGSLSDATIQIGHTDVSRRHAYLWIQHKSACLFDLRSTNGTFVNGEKVDGKVILPDTATIRFGGVDVLCQKIP